MQETVTIRTQRLLKANDIKKILSERFHTPVENITCKGYYSFEVITEEEVNKEDLNKQADE